MSFIDRYNQDGYTALIGANSDRVAGEDLILVRQKRNVRSFPIRINMPVSIDRFIFPIIIGIPYSPSHLLTVTHLIQRVSFIAKFGRTIRVKNFNTDNRLFVPLNDANGRF